jgi:hypothetical protein
MNEDPSVVPTMAMGRPFPVGAEHVVGGGADGSPALIPSFNGNPDVQAQGDLNVRMYSRLH